MLADKNTIGSQQSIHSIFDKLSISKEFLEKVEKNGLLSIE